MSVRHHPELFHCPLHQTAEASHRCINATGLGTDTEVTLLTTSHLSYSRLAKSPITHHCANVTSHSAPATAASVSTESRMPHPTIFRRGQPRSNPQQLAGSRQLRRHCWHRTAPSQTTARQQTQSTRSTTSLPAATCPQAITIETTPAAAEIRALTSRHSARI